MTSSQKAVFFDIDGTIFNHGDGPFKDDVEAMEEAVALGHKLFLNTGRSFGNIPPKVLELPLWSGVCAGGGAHVLLSSPSPREPQYKTIYHKWLSQELVTKIVDWYIKNKKTLVLEGEADCYLVNPIARRFSVRPGKVIAHKDDFANHYPDDFITKLTLPDALDSAERNLLESFFKLTVFKDYSEAIIKGENKATAMQIALDAVGIPREASVAMGDSANDMDMIRYAGLGIAMGNAVSELKAAAGAVTGNCGEGGAALALRRFVI